MIGKNLATIAVGLLAVVASSLAAAQIEERIRARLAPEGNVCVAGQPCAAGIASSTAAAGGGEARDPAQIYQTACFACHGTGAGDAPVLGNVAAWAPRIEQGMDVLYNSTINGLGAAMPARGLCMDCSDDELRAVTDYIVEQSQ